MKFTATLLSLVAAATMVSAGQLVPADRPNPEVVQGAYIIEYQDGIDHNKANNFLNSRKVQYKVRGQFSTFNGASIQVKSSHSGEDLAKIPGVKRVWPVEVFTLPPQPKKSQLGLPTDPIKQKLTSAHTMTGVDYIQKAFKYTGKGVKVGIIDSGVDYTHPALGGCFGRGCRVRYGWDFVGEDYDTTGVAKGDSDPRDQCNGHGTHVAGIIGADARKVGAPIPFVGVAPEVTFGAYRIFSCAGHGASDIIMQGMELAFNQGMDIINMSLGGGSAWRNNPLAILAEKLHDLGMTTIAAAGNDGDQGAWMVSNAGLGVTSTSVASFDNIAGNYFYLTYGGGAEHPYSIATAYGKPSVSLPANTPLVPLLEKDGSLSDGCAPEPYATANAKGKIVLVLGDISRCRSGGRGATAVTAGAAGMVIQTTPLGLSGIAGVADFPMVSVEHAVGDEILAAYNKNNKAAFTWSTQKKLFKVEGGGSPSDFSSWGFDGNLHLKPDLAAPGGNILSTYPVNMGSYAIESGTSMATPYVVGAHALLYNAHKRVLRGKDARQIFMNTAYPGHFAGNHTDPAPVAKQGAGLINVRNALLTASVFSPDKIELLDSVHFTGKSVEVRVKNVGKKTVEYTLSHEFAESGIHYRDGNTFPLAVPFIENDHASVKFSSNKIQVKAGQTAKVKVQFTLPKTGKNEEFPFYSGWVVATPKGKDAVPVRIPYSGVKGDVAKLPIQDTSVGAPLFRLSRGGKAVAAEPGHKIDFSVETPVILSRLGSHTPDLTFRLVDAKTGAHVGHILTQYGNFGGEFGRSKNLDDKGRLSVLTVSWSGPSIFKDSNPETKATPVPSGHYKVVVASQHQLTKGVYPDDYEVIEVADITI